MIMGGDSEVWVPLVGYKGCPFSCLAPAHYSGTLLASLPAQAGSDCALFAPSWHRASSALSSNPCPEELRVVSLPTNHIDNLLKVAACAYDQVQLLQSGAVWQVRHTMGFPA